MDDAQRQAWKAAVAAKAQKVSRARGGGVQKGMGPNKAAGRKGGIRRQGSKRG